ncbi:hypothetical protein N7476_004939 [Penicillium atrosanguineum]|uniref:Xylanolytic transcriptional activator regulatory domain-containing protein n=1 Tax=Penicillium atrosanguineum TaxID=1132637 RepID=A0A9W9U506_9EURO|nr:hypothetical protein N7476_004939 [Penicillium atrosanguineum]
MREEEPLTTCSFVGVAVRAAQMFGLHKDLQHFQDTASLQMIAEIRRRMWWHIYALDVLVTTAAGLPLLIDRSSFDVALPSDVREDLWETTQAQPYMGLAYSAESVPGLIASASAGGISIRKYIILSCANRFASFQWCWPGNHQPLHALMVLLKDFERDPTASDAVATRRLIDETVALCDTGGGVNSTDGRTDARRRPLIEGGREAWDLIRKLRGTVYVKLGLDPDILPTREQVTDLARRLLEDIGMNPNVLVEGENYILHDTLTTIATDTLDCPPFTSVANVSAIDLMGESSAISPSLRFDWNDWNTLFPI